MIFIRILFHFDFPAFLCGLSGFVTFLDEQVISEIVQWQVPETGCYEYFDGDLDEENEETVSVKRKRNAVLLSGNCSDHMTGLAAAAFGLFVKISTEFFE